MRDVLSPFCLFLFYLLRRHQSELYYQKWFVDLIIRSLVLEYVPETDQIPFPFTQSIKPSDRACIPQRLTIPELHDRKREARQLERELWASVPLAAKLTQPRRCHSTKTDEPLKSR